MREILRDLWRGARYSIVIRAITSVPLDWSLLDVSASYICDLLYRPQLVMLGRRLSLIMFNLILGPSRILCLRRLKHDRTLWKGHFRWILSIMCPSILLNLLDLVDLRLPVIDRLHLQGVVRAHSRRMGLVKLLWRAHNEVVVVSRRRRVHGFHYKVVPFVFLVEGTVPRRGTLLQLL